MASEENKNAANRGKPLHTMMELVLVNSDVAKIVIEEFKDLTLRYVRKMRLFPYPDYDYNKYPFMCTIILEEIFLYAQEHPEEPVKMFVGDIRSEFYGEHWLLDKIGELAKKGIKFDIVLAKPPHDDYLQEWQALNTNYPDCVRVRMKPAYNAGLRHLVLVGDAYRIEAPHPDYEGEVTELSPERPARFGFHDKFYAHTDVLDHWNSAVDTPDTQPLPVA